MENKKKKAQGAIEYLLLIGAGVLVAVVIIATVIGTATDMGPGIQGILESWTGIVSGEDVTSTFPIGELAVKDAGDNSDVDRGYNLTYIGTPLSAVITFTEVGWDEVGYYCLYVDGTEIWSQTSKPPLVGGKHTVSVPAPPQVPGSHTLTARSANNSDCSNFDPPADDYSLKDIEISVTYTAG